MTTARGGNLKQWRESASVILVAKTAFGPARCVRRNNTAIASKHRVEPSSCNYKLLTIKRSSRSGFMPGTYVFPGGNVEPLADGSRDWLALYKRFGFPVESFAKLLEPPERAGAEQPAIFRSADTTSPTDVIPKGLSLRIGAIRETFEECGILICRSYKIDYRERSARWASFIGGPEIKLWQDRVHDDPAAFIDLCAKFEVYPDVWALKEWSNWATPQQLKVRFDTVFYLATFHQTPATCAEKQEVQHLEWATPTEYLIRNQREKIAIPPPQYYEMCRLRNFTDIERLSRFAAERAPYGVERYFPNRISTEEGMFSVLPGDDLYDVNVDPENLEIPHMDHMPDSYVQNRMYHKNLFTNQIITRNLTPKFKQIVPLGLESTDSKL